MATKREPRQWTKEDSARMDEFAKEAVEELTKIMNSLKNAGKTDTLSGMILLMAFHNRWSRDAGHRRLNAAYRDIFVPAFKDLATQDKDQADV